MHLSDVSFMYEDTHEWDAVIDFTYQQEAVMLLVRKHIKIIDKLIHIFSFDIKSIQSICQI